MSYVFKAEPQTVPKVRTKNRTIKTNIPATGTVEALSKLAAVESRSMHGQLPLVWNKAEDYSVYDIAGNKWIDFTSAIFVANVGHSNTKVSDAIKMSIREPLYSCYNYANPLRVKYLEKLIHFAGKPFEKAFLLSAGTEATDAALKLMRMNGQKISKRRRGVICIENNWHGRTLGAQMMSSNKAQSSWIGYTDNDIHHIPFPYPWCLQGQTAEDFLRQSLDELPKKGVDLSRDICGFMLESFQGWGAIFYPTDFVQAIKRICLENQILLAFDEMQAGFGRTGKKFGFEHYDVEPDLICVGKGMGGGVPLSGVIGTRDVMDLPAVGNMSSTHSANPMVCAAGLAVIEELEEKELIAEAYRKGKILQHAFGEIQRRFPERVAWVLGKGLIRAMLFKVPGSNEADGLFASKVVERCMQKGLLLVHTGRESIKIGPPLTIADDAMLEGVEVLSESIYEISGE